MSKSDKLIEAWKRLVESMARKEGLTSRQAELRARRYFPELYELYQEAIKEKELATSKGGSGAVLKNHP